MPTPAIKHNDTRDPNHLEACPFCGTPGMARRVDHSHEQPVPLSPFDLTADPLAPARGILVAVAIMLITILMILGVLWIAFSPNAARANQLHAPKPVPIPASHAKARSECPLNKPLVCRAALVRAYEAVAWNRKQRLHQRHLPASNLTPVEVGRELAARRNWAGRQFACLYTLWNRESGWQISDPNPVSQADGIPQANPASKMSSAGADWRTNAATQIIWGLGYIAQRYGTPCGALEHSNAHGYY